METEVSFKKCCIRSYENGNTLIDGLPVEVVLEKVVSTSATFLQSTDFNLTAYPAKDKTFVYFSREPEANEYLTMITFNGQCFHNQLLFPEMEIVELNISSFPDGNIFNRNQR